MKGNSKSPVSPLFTLFFILLLLSCLASARVLNQNFEQGDQKLKAADGTANNELMGLDEICGKEGEECTNERKLLAQAHLDYIYTQKHPRP